ncbi:hypothetical protein ACO0LF_18240 [Undibacterium sp. Di27W]|uniref:hypothetical protein n=1 Tax=Undibacterium sp. Di27W TaxID=3413036 RepID=UPI003BF283A5
MKLYPCLSSYEDDDESMDECPWSDGPLIDNFGGRVAILGISHSHGEVLSYILLCADKLKLSIIDPQTAAVYRPGSAQLVQFIQKQKQLELEELPWNRSTLKDMMFSYLEPVLARLGFALKKNEGISEKKFTRKIKGGSQDIVLASYDFSLPYRVVLTTYTYLDVIDDLSRKIHARAYRSYMEIGQEYFTGTVTSEDANNLQEFLVILEDLGVLLVEKIIPYLDQCQDIFSIDEKMNPAILPGIDTMVDIEYRALIVAWLANNPNLIKLVDYYREKSKDDTKEERKYLEKTIAYLLQHKNDMISA